MLSEQTGFRSEIAEAFNLFNEETAVDTKEARQGRQNKIYFLPVYGY